MKSTKQTKIAGFTLIELLVVVLIIGILSAVTLPQYTKAVEKSRLTEVQIIAKSLQDAIDIYLLENGKFAAVQLKDGVFPIQLSCDSWDNNFCKIKQNVYNVWCSTKVCEIEAQTPNCGLVYTKNSENPTWEKTCYTYSNDKGRMLCNLFTNEGYIYKDMDY